MYFDYHTHSSFSDDSDTPLADMLEQACKLGLAEIAVTDHYDPGYPDPDFPFQLDFDKYHETLEKYASEYAGRLRIVKGIELGLTHERLADCEKAATSYAYDYIIGSFHCAHGEPLYAGHFFDGKSAKDAFCDYFTYVYDNLKVYKEYCNVGHLNLVARYSPLGTPDFSDYSDIIEAILKMLIADGKGIELNTSSFRYHMDDTCPSKEILSLYRELGGEILTIGSDAHSPDRLIDHFDFARDYLKSLGFKYLATFKARKPTFVEI